MDLEARNNEIVDEIDGIEGRIAGLDKEIDE